MVFSVRLGVIGYLVFHCLLWAQLPLQVPTSVNSGLVMDAAGPDQREQIRAVFPGVFTAAGQAPEFFSILGGLCRTLPLSRGATNKTFAGSLPQMRRDGVP